VDRQSTAEAKDTAPDGCRFFRNRYRRAQAALSGLLALTVLVPIDWPRITLAGLVLVVLLVLAFTSVIIGILRNAVVITRDGFTAYEGLRRTRFVPWRDLDLVWLDPAWGAGSRIFVQVHGDRKARLLPVHSMRKGDPAVTELKDILTSRIRWTGRSDDIGTVES